MAPTTNGEAYFFDEQVFEVTFQAIPQRSLRAIVGGKAVTAWLCRFEVVSGITEMVTAFQVEEGSNRWRIERYENHFLTRKAAVEFAIKDRKNSYVERNPDRIRAELREWLDEQGNG